MNTAELLARLERHYIKPGQPLPGGVFVPECGWNGGSNGTRCDALYVGFTTTSGRLLVGHELKVSRSDWLHELDQPTKAGPWADQCHQWWVVAPDTTIVRPEELPPGWGLMVPGRSKTRLDVKTRAATHTDRTPSWEAVRSVLARQDTLRMQAIEQARRKFADDATREVQKRVQEHADRTDPDARDLREKVAKIEEILGFRLRDWAWRDDDAIDWDTLGHACRIAKAAVPLREIGEQLGKRYNRPTDRLRQMLKDLDKAVSAVQAATELVPDDEQPALPMLTGGAS